MVDEVSKVDKGNHYYINLFNFINYSLISSQYHIPSASCTMSAH